MRQINISVSALYGVAAIVSVAAPASALMTIDNVVTWSFILLAGVPLGVIAAALGLLHAQYGLIERVYRRTAIACAVTAWLVLAPLEIWVPFQGAPIIHWARVTATAIVALLFAQLTVRVWKLPGKASILLALGFGSVALFFGFRARRYIVPSDDVGLEAATGALAEFFLDGVVTCGLLLPGLVAGWIARRRRLRESSTG